MVLKLMEQETAAALPPCVIARAVIAWSEHHPQQSRRVLKIEINAHLRRSARARAVLGAESWTSRRV
jgi:hypothetical protein